MRTRIANPGTILRVAESTPLSNIYSPTEAEICTDSAGLVVRFYDCGDLTWHSLYLTVEAAEAVALATIARRDEGWDDVPHVSAA